MRYALRSMFLFVCVVYGAKVQQIFGIYKYFFLFYSFCMILFFCVHMEIGFSYWLKMRQIGDTLLLHGKKRGCITMEIAN